MRVVARFCSTSPPLLWVGYKITSESLVGSLITVPHHS